MKKYLLSIFAILLAIGFSAFKPVQKPTRTYDQFGYWYHVVGGEIGAPIYEVPGTPVDKYAYAITSANNCDYSGSILCVVGYPTQLFENGDVPSDVAPDGKIFKE